MTQPDTNKHKKTQRELGNTNTNSRCRKWCFTLNNYTEEEYNSLLSYLDTKNTRTFILGKEIGKEGTPHIQGYLEAKNPISFSTLKKLNSRLHLEKSKGSTEQNIKYCSKENNYKTNYNMKKLLNKKDYCLSIEYSNVIWKDYQATILSELDNGTPDKRKINWYYEFNGNVGKSFLCKYISLKYDNVIISEGKKDNVYNQILTLYNNKDFDITKPIICILDISRHNQDYINYGCIESIKNGLIYSGKYEGGTCVFPTPFIYIFSNEKPDMYKWSEDRYNVVEI